MANVIPKDEIVWCKTTTTHGDVYYTTSKADRGTYYLYKEENGSVVKVGKAKTPAELEKKYIKM